MRKAQPKEHGGRDGEAKPAGSELRRPRPLAEILAAPGARVSTHEFIFR